MNVDEEIASAAEQQPAPHASDNIPVQTNTPDPVQVAKDEPAPAAEPAASAPAKDEPVADKRAVEKLPDWAQKVVADAAFEAREAKRAAKQAVDDLAAERAAKLKPAAPTNADAEAARAAAPEPDNRFGGYKTQADFDAAVQEEATKRETVARQNRDAEAFNKRSNDTYAKGVAEHGDDFKTAVLNLQAANVMGKDILDLVFEMDAPEAILLELGRDPGRATEIMQMTPAKRALEIAKLSVTPAKKAVVEPLSKAPPPVRPVEGSARASTELKDDDDDATWMAKRNAEIAARHAAGG